MKNQAIPKEIVTIVETLEKAGYKETQKDFYPFSFVNASQPSEEIFPKVSI